MVGVIGKDCIYLCADARAQMDIPIIGREYYDFPRKLSAIDDKDKLWMAGVGISDAGESVYEELKKRKLSGIHQLNELETDFFRNHHGNALKRYNLIYKGHSDLSNCMTLLFAGIDVDNKPKMCLVDSAAEYRFQWFDNEGDFVFNRIGDNVDSCLNKCLITVSQGIKKNENMNVLLKQLKEIFLNVARTDIGVSPLMYFVKIMEKEAKYKEFYHIKRIIDKFRYNFDVLLYIKILQLHKTAGGGTR